MYTQLIDATWNIRLVILQLLVATLPADPLSITGFTQLNHDEPTNAIKETTVTSERGGFTEEAWDPTEDHPHQGFTAETWDFIEDRIDEINVTDDKYLIETTTDVASRPNNLTIPHIEIVAKKGQHLKSKHRDVDSRKISIEKQKSSKVNIYKSKSDSKKIFYNPSDPYSIIFGEVKTEFLTDKSLNEKRYNGTISGKINTGLEGVRDMIIKYNRTFKTFKELQENLRDSEFKIKVTNFQEEKESFGSEQEEKEIRDVELNKKIRYIAKSHPKNPFDEWDAVSEEQEKVFEQMFLDGKNKYSDEISRNDRWFLLLLAGNSTIVKLRQRDFAKYLKLNLAARLSLEYDDLRVNKVLLMPPRLVVNVSVVTSVEDEEAPLHKLAETNATLLELSGEEYHVVRFLSLRSQVPVSLDDDSAATSVIVNDRHSDIEVIILLALGGACAVTIIASIIIALIRYLRHRNISCVPKLWVRHQRMDENRVPTIGGPLTVIYSGSYTDSRNRWMDDFQTNSIFEEEQILRPPVYGFGALSNSALPDIREAEASASPKVSLDRKLHILGCRPNQLLLPLCSVRIQGVDNPNYQT